MVNESHQDSNRGGFTGPVSSNEPHDDSSRQLQVDVVESEMRIDLVTPES
jgi:hypothetical protein